MKWLQVGKKKVQEAKLTSKNVISVHKVSSNGKRYLRLYFPYDLTKKLGSVRFAVQSGGGDTAVIGAEKSNDSFPVGYDYRNDKNYVTFRAERLPLKKGKYVASVPVSRVEGLGRVLFYLHRVK